MKRWGSKPKDNDESKTKAPIVKKGKVSYDFDFREDETVPDPEVEEVDEPRVAEPEPMRDERLDEVMPLVVEVIGRLLGAKGMQRYRADFVEKVKGIMEGGESEEGKV